MAGVARAPDSRIRYVSNSKSWFISCAVGSLTSQTKEPEDMSRGKVEDVDSPRIPCKTNTSSPPALAYVPPEAAR